jgi:hypothetical protein
MTFGNQKVKGEAGFNLEGKLTKAEQDKIKLAAKLKNKFSLNQPDLGDDDDDDDDDA